MAFAHSVAASVTHFISVKVVEGLGSAFRKWASVAVMRIEAIINVAVEVVWAMEPRAGTDEHATTEPLGPIVAVERSCTARSRSSHTGTPVLVRY